MFELTEKILFLVPKANVVVRESMRDDEEIQVGWSKHNLNNLIVIWHDNNSMPCPTQAQIDAIDTVALNTKKEADRKSIRDKQYSKDLSMKAAYRIEKKGNPNLTFSQFLDELENELT